MLGHAHYILRMTDPDRVFSSMSEEIKIKIFVVYSHKIQKVPAHSITTTCSTLKKSTLFLGRVTYVIQRKIRCLAPALYGFIQSSSNNFSRVDPY